MNWKCKLGFHNWGEMKRDKISKFDIQRCKECGKVRYLNQIGPNDFREISYARFKHKRDIVKATKNWLYGEKSLSEI